MVETRVIAVTASAGGIGKSSVSTLLASATSLLGYATVLIDANPANADQLQHQRESFLKLNVPGRMPTLMDDAFPEQWWSDPRSGVQLVPGARSIRDRTREGVATATTRAVERARGAVDVVVLDMEPWSRSRYARDLLSLADVVLGITNHEKKSRSHLRAELDWAATKRYGEDELMPDLDPNEVRLVHSCRQALSPQKDAVAWEGYRGEMGEYEWAGRFVYDPQMSSSKDARDLVQRVSEGTQRTALELAAGLMGWSGELPELRRRRFGVWLSKSRLSPFDALAAARAQRSETVASPVPSTADVQRAVVESGPRDGQVELRLLSAPVRVAGADLDEESIAVVALAATQGPVAVDAAAERLGMSRDRLLEVAGRCGLVSIHQDMLSRSARVDVDVTEVQALADRIADADPSDRLLVEAVGLLERTDGAVFGVDSSASLWRWVDVQRAGQPSPRQTAVRELASLVRVTAGLFTQLSPPPVETEQLVELLLSIGARVARVADPMPIVTAVRTVANAASDPVLRRRVNDLVRPVWDTDVDDRADLVEQLASAFAAGAARDLVDSAAAGELAEPVVKESPEGAVGDVDIAPLVGGAGRPEVWLQTLNEVRMVPSPEKNHCLSVPFVLAAAERPLTQKEVSAATNYTQSSLANTFTTDASVVQRDAGRLTLTAGVWLDHHWMLECVRRARNAVDGEVGRRWTAEVFQALLGMETAPYGQVPGKERHWRWVDEFPDEILPARRQAEVDVVDAALAVVELWQRYGLDDTVSSDDVASELGRIARLIPSAPVMGGRTSGEQLLIAAGNLEPSTNVMNELRRHATRLISSDAIAASAELAAVLHL